MSTPSSNSSSSIQTHPQGLFGLVVWGLQALAGFIQVQAMLLTILLLLVAVPPWPLLWSAVALALLSARRWVYPRQLVTTMILVGLS